MTDSIPAPLSWPTDWRVSLPPDGQTQKVVILAHGAGAGMDTPFLDVIAAGIAAIGWAVVRFEFPYMAARREEPPRKRPPDRLPVLIAHWEAVLSEVRRLMNPRHLVLAGKSMGGRVASLIADRVQAQGLIVLGFPFHPAGKPEKALERSAHLRTLQTPTLICQGTRDALGARAVLEEVSLSSVISVHWLEDGDHSFKPRKASGRSHPQAIEEANAEIKIFLKHLLRES